MFQFLRLLYTGWSKNFAYFFVGPTPYNHQILTYFQTSESRKNYDNTVTKEPTHLK